ncbi:MAG TPA: VWA domain-containing protein [Candidatus Aquilonibacter sp.]|nr:VWA domain-containing protein [Candidatus Aquilonibacter sp.]
MSQSFRVHRSTPTLPHGFKGRLKPFVNFSVALALALSAGPAARSVAQQNPAPDSQSPSYTLHTSSRIVLTDVTVKDRKGHIVHGLPESAFHIFDNNRPQTISSFEEHDAAPTAIQASSVSTPNTYSNDFLQHLPPVLNIVVLDTTSLSLPDQMYLAWEFNNFLKTLPPNLPLAIYARTGDAVILVQSFTADRKLLLEASRKVMPHLPPPGRDPVVISDYALLDEISIELAQLPGRKNVLWFSGGERLQTFDPRTVSDPGDLRQAYDLLEKARISIYPIDARGLLVSHSPGLALQHLQMEETAAGTGGEAFYNRNGLKLAAQQILSSDNSFYTLVFSPNDFEENNKWHEVKVKVEGGDYQLSYRRGYFADGYNMDGAPRKSNTMLLTNGETQTLPADLRSSPIIFTASVVPANAPSPDPTTQFRAFNDAVNLKHGEKLYTIRYSLPPDVFASRLVDDRENAAFEVAVLAFNQAGEKIDERADRVRVKFPENNPHMPINVAQNIALRRGDLFLYIAIWDTTTGRAGTLQIPFTAH